MPPVRADGVVGNRIIALLKAFRLSNTHVNDGLPGTAEVPVANTQPLATWLCLPQPVGQSRGACLGSRSETTPDRLHSHGLLLHGIVCREGIEEQSMHGVDASKLLHGFIRIEHRAVGVIKSMSLDRMPT